MKQKHCKLCDKPYNPFNSFQTSCSINCALKLIKQRRKAKTAKLKDIVKPDKLRSKCDILVQKIYTKGKCESCGLREASCVHHYIYKSQSNFLRYKISNLIPICSECHTRHHKSGDSEIMSRVIAKRGIEWEQELQQTRRTPCKLTVEYLQKIYDELEGKTN